MKRIILFILPLLLLSCKGEEKKEGYTPMATETAEGAAASLTPSQQAGQEIFNGKGNCYTCHKPETKSIGPSIKDIAKAYEKQNGDMAAFLREKADPIVDPKQYATMKTNFYITKHFTDEEMNAVVDYVMSFQ